MRKPRKKFSVSNHQTRDPVGKAVQLYWHGLKTNQPVQYSILVEADLIEDDTIPVDYLFRSWQDMPVIEQLALDACKGKVLDVGAAAGCHAAVLQERGFEVLAIDTSFGAIEVLRDRGIPARKVDFYQMQPEGAGFDRILLLMNGLGLARDIESLPSFFQKLDLLLAADGEVLLDSSDFDTEAEAFSQINYQMRFLNHKSKCFPWLYLPFKKLSEYASSHGFSAELLHQDEHGSYLAKLKKAMHTK